MTLDDAIRLISKLKVNDFKPQRWADLGCGKGMFSFALASLLPVNSRIFCIDKTDYHFPSYTQNGISLEFHKMDFTEQSLPGTELDGILMANSLHFLEDRDKEKLIPDLASSLKNDGSFLIIEYDTDQSSWWNPHPVPYSDIRKLFKTVGFTEIKKIGYRPSGWGPKNMYVCEIERG